MKHQPRAIPTPLPIGMWRTQLAPWLKALRKDQLVIALPALPTVDDMATLWLEVRAPERRHNTLAVWTRLAQAMELIDLLARVDQCVAWRLLLELSGHLRLLDQCDRLLPRPPARWLPRFMIKVSDHEIYTANKSTLRGLLTFVLASERRVSPKFQCVKTFLLQQWAEILDGQAADRFVTLALDFELDSVLSTDEAAEIVISQISCLHADPAGVATRLDAHCGGATANAELDSNDIVGDEDCDCYHENHGSAAIGGAAAACAETGVPFRIDSWRIHSFKNVTTRVLHRINQAAAKGTRFTQFSFTKLIHGQLRFATIGGFLIDQLVPWRNGCLGRIGIDTLQLDMSAIDLPGVQALSTAIARSQSLRQVVLDSTRNGRGDARGGSALWWPWFAYALFSNDADHAIHTSLLNVKTLRLAHVQAIHELLRHNDPLRYLYETGATSREFETEPPMMASLSPSHVIRIGRYQVSYPNQAQGIPSLRVPEQGATYQVLRNHADEDYIEIIVPGTGVCWTNRCHLVALTPLVRRKAHPIRHLTLSHIGEESIEPVIGLLHLIGGPITQLTIVGAHLELPARNLHQVFVHCPNLVRLELESVPVASLNWILRPTRNLKALCICVEDDVREHIHFDWGDLFQALCDVAHPLTQSLRQLHISFRLFKTEHAGVQSKIESILQCSLAMLDKNVLLQRCEFSLCGPATVAKYRRRFAAHHNTPLPERVGPLTGPQKLAFLGTLTALRIGTVNPDKKTKELQPLARHKIDHDVVSLIMAFAAKTERRICGID